MVVWIPTNHEGMMRAIFLAVILCSKVYGDWSAPVTVYSGLQAFNPVVGIDGSGNGVIASLASTSPMIVFVRTNQFVGGVALNPFDYTTTGITNPSLPNISVNAAGNAIVTWNDFDGISMTNLWAANFLSGTWEITPSQLSTESLTAAVPAGTYLDGMNRGIATWSATNGLYSIYANRSIGQVWQGEQLLYTPDMLEGPYVPIDLLAGTPAGTALTVSVQSSIDPETLASDFFNGTTWESFSSDFVTDVFNECVPTIALAMMPNGIAILVYQSNDGLTSISINEGVPDISSSSVLYSVGDPSEIQSAAVGIDGAGNAIALWVVNGMSGDFTLYANRYSGGAWEGSPTILDHVDPGSSNITSPNIQFDGAGNAIAVWDKTDATGMITSVYYDTYTLGMNSWATEGSGTLLSAMGDNAQQPDLAMNSNGYAIAVWSVTTNSGQNIQAAYLLNVGPASPRNLQGSQVKNKFLLQTDLVNILNWGASSDSSVVNYFVFRNGVQIGTVSSSASLTYEDHNRQKGVSYTYAVTAVNGSGNQSAPLTVTIL
jgi:hypothetical protein